MTAGGATATLCAFDDARVPELMSWFPDRASCLVWGGPEFRFPFTEASFRVDAKLASLLDLVWATGLSLRSVISVRRRCHLGRLAVAPAFRGGGLGTQLVRELCTEGRALFGAGSCSLFVVPSNRRAKALYEKLGFAATPYPEPAPDLDLYIYMVTSADGPRLG